MFGGERGLEETLTALEKQTEAATLRVRSVSEALAGQLEAVTSPEAKRELKAIDHQDGRKELFKRYGEVRALS
jgi:hypothetical protein